MAFQRSYSKVWWGSDDNQLSGMNVMNSANQHILNTKPNFISLTSGGIYSNFSQQHQQQQRHPQQYQQFGGSAYHSLDLNQYKFYGGNLSRIQEVEDEHNISKLSWEKHDSPGSLRSQDSGFSDNDEYHSNRSLSAQSSKISSSSNKSIKSSKSNLGSPTSTRTVETPPTVIRRPGNSEFYTPLVNVSRRISFTCSATPKNKTSAYEEEEGSSLMAKLDNMQLMTESPLAKKLDFDDESMAQSSDAFSPVKVNNPRIKKRKKVQRKSTSPLSICHKRLQKLKSESQKEEEHSDLDSSLAVPEYNNETVFLGEAPTCSTPPPPYNNETIVLGGPMETSYDNNSKLIENSISPLRLLAKFSGNTSTPKTLKIQKPSCALPPLLACREYDNSLIKGHNEDVQTWLGDLRMSYDHEVMSTLQTKSIAQEAFKSLQITTNAVTKFIRQLQQKALSMQSSFEKVERMLSGAQNVSLHDALMASLHLLDHISEFTLILERRSVFFADSRLERKRYDEYLDQIRMVNKDTRYSLENHHYINLESLLEDLQVLKRILLISVQKVYEKLIRILVTSVENGHCDLMLKANINMIATLMNIDYEGFASLINAFIQTEAVRALLVICLDHKLSSVRAQALRALATICCAPEPIAQLGSCGGIEIIRDILQVTGTKNPKNDVTRGDMEKREAVSLLTQITAAWHGPEHKVSGLKDCVEAIVEGLTQLLLLTECPQILLLCTAALNNLSRIEITSHYSIMSHETIFKLITSMEKRDKGINIFLYEQIAAMLYNMSLNKKCHSHLANAGIINFITYAYETEFYKKYNSRGESEAQKRCIKTILYTLTRLVQDSVLGMELLEQQKHMPTSFKLNSTQDVKQKLSLDVNSNSSCDISLLAHQLLQQAKNNRDEQLKHQQHLEVAEKEKKFKMQLQRQESYV
ncbi:spindle orientation adaptor protein inscuteable isoform 1-T3 [Cochliomyia hominivorax]